ncbi:MAG: hypothetical protein CSA50_01010 [Gammaproteobacteria bacterium]|nr:MAG: hypothetical protein CSA50_01010 [Gammaproteobacteria bacterium]
MSFLVAVSIVLAVLGSIFWIMPSPAERKKMMLRNIAIQKGFEVRYVYDTDKDLSGEEQYIAYSISAEKLGLAKSRPFELKLLSDAAGPGGWKVVLSIDIDSDQSSVLAHQLSNYASHIAKLTLSQSRLTFYWQERADKDVLEALIDDVVSHWGALIADRRVSEQPRA